MSGRQACESGSATTTATAMQKDDGPAAATRPKSVRRRSARRDDKQQDASHRNPSGPQAAQADVSMVTEYRERFLPPFCQHTATSPSAVNPKHQQDSNNIETTVRVCVTHKMKKPTTAASRAEACKDRRGHKSAARRSNSSRQGKMDFKTTYMQDFQAWHMSPQQPIILKDNLDVSQGLGYKQPEDVSPLARVIAWKPKPEPMERQTTYSLAFAPHELSVRPRRVRKRVGQPSEPAVSPEPTAATHSNQEPPPEVVHRMKVWSVETRRRGSRAPAELRSPRGSPAGNQSSAGTDDAHQATTTMEEDWELWNAPRRPDDRAAKRRGNNLHVEFNVPAEAEVLLDVRCCADDERAKGACCSGCVDMEGAPQGSQQTEHGAH